MDKQLQKVAHQWMRDKKLVVEMKHIMPDAERQLISYMKQVHLKSMRGNSCAIKYDDDVTCSEFYTALERELRVADGSLKIIRDGNVEARDDSKVSDHKWEESAAIHLIPAMLGDLATRDAIFSMPKDMEITHGAAVGLGLK